MTWRFGADLPDQLRRWGLDVVEVDGWQARGVPFTVRPVIVVAHHTATSARAAGDYPSLGIVRDGREGLAGPLSQFGLGRSGRVYVIASGKANHAGAGAWDGISTSTMTVGIEAESPGDGTWTDEQRRAYPLLAAAVCAYLGTPARRVCGHREWALPAGRKPDPTGIDLTAFRAAVAGHLHAGPEGDDMTDEQARQLKAVHDALYGDTVNRFGETTTLYETLKDTHLHARWGDVHAQAVRAELGALRGVIDALAGRSDLTAEQIRQAAEDGAKAALDAVIDSARTEVVVKDAS